MRESPEQLQNVREPFKDVAERRRRKIKGTDKTDANGLTSRGVIHSSAFVELNPAFGTAAKGLARGELRRCIESAGPLQSHGRPSARKTTDAKKVEEAELCRSAGQRPDIEFEMSSAVGLAQRRCRAAGDATQASHSFIPCPHLRRASRLATMLSRGRAADTVLATPRLSKRWKQEDWAPCGLTLRNLVSLQQCSAVVSRLGQ